MKRIAFFVVFATAAIARAQPMIDPSQMSGIPRPDPKFPPGVLSVRLLRGDFAHPLVGQEVTLTGPDGARTEKSDETAHAVFKELSAGATYTVKSSAFGQELQSQPIQMPESPGVVVMLVFPPDDKAQLGEPDGKARLDEKLPSGTVEVKVVDENDKPLAQLEVILAHAKKDSEKVEEKKALTDGEGRARFEHLVVSEVDGYLASARREGGTTTSRPFRLQANGGSLVALRSLKVTHSSSAISINEKSHFIAEVKDDAVEVVENFFLENDGDPYDPGKDGLKIPLPDDAEGAQVPPNGPQNLTADGKLVTWKGVLPPGETQITIAFTLPQHHASVELHQLMLFSMPRVAVVTDRFDGMQVDGAGLQSVEREQNGRKFWVVTGPAVKAGGFVDVRLSGLPHASAWGRWLATLLALAIAIWGIIFSIHRKEGPSHRARLEQRRNELLNELAQQGPAGEKKRGRDELLGKLEKIYRELDETGG